jgi:hypothetical protein
MPIDGKTIAIVVLVLLFVFVIFNQKASGFVLGGSAKDDTVVVGESMANTNMHKLAGVHEVQNKEEPSMPATPAALLPNEVPVSDNFGQFSAQDIIENQNYLDPRNQMGYPETVGGVMRNSNLQYRSEPMNPRDPVSIFNLSTIPPDTMRPTFEIQDREYQ